MKYGIGLISGAGAVNIVNAPEIGAESRVSVSYDPWVFLGSLSQPAIASGIFTAESGATFGDGLDVQLVADTPVLSDAALVVTLNVTLEDDSAGTAVATFANQSYFKDQSNNRAQFAAVDLIPAGTGNAAKKIKAINGMNSVTGGEAGNRFWVVSLPEADSFHAIGCKVSVDGTLPYKKSVAVACGYKAAAFTKPGRSDVPQLTVTARHFSEGDGLPRLSGHVVTALIETYKDDRTLDQRLVLGNWRPSSKTPRGEGDDEVTDTAEGMFSDAAVFTT